jgi:N-acetylmuramoyl-L-alanine amidase
MGRFLFGVTLTLVLAGGPWTTAGARSLSVVVEGAEGTLRGQVEVIFADDGGPYVSLDRLARLLKVKPLWTDASLTAVFKVGSRSARLTRNRSQVLVGGNPLTLGAPPRVLQSGWVVPEEFLTRVLPKLYGSVKVAQAEWKPPVKVARAPVVLEDIRFRSYPSFTRVVLEGSGPFGFRIEPQASEVRVALRGVSPERSRAQEVGDGLVRELRLSPVGGEATLRVGLEAARGEVRAMTLEEPYRLVLDIHRARAPIPTAEAGGPVEPLRRIVLDAGHGGHDPGAVGAAGLQEKEVVLDVTRRVARLVEAGLGVKVSLTRAGDYFVPLRDRTQLANKERAQLFVSIHANAHRASVSRGVEIYFLSSEATDNEARQVAALENGVIQLEGGNSRAHADIVKTILWDLAQSEFQEESSRLAETVQDAMARSLRIASRGVKQAGFYVLGGAAMPAILVELGFLTNPTEERRLMDPQYRDQVARAIYAGLAEYKRVDDQKMRAARTAGATP